MLRPIDATVVMNATQARAARDFLLSCVFIVCDVETFPKLGIMDIVGYSGITDAGVVKTFVYPLYAGLGPSSGIPTDIQVYFDCMRDINASGIGFGFQNGPYDLFWLILYQIPVANYVHDSMSMWWSMYPELPKTLDFIASVLLDDYQYWKADRKSKDPMVRWMYNALDNDRTLRIILKMLPMLERNAAARRNYWDAHKRVIIAFGMSIRGFPVSEAKFAEHGAKLEQDAEKALDRLRYLTANPEFNPKSPKQKVELLYRMLGARPRNARGRFVNKIEEASTGAMPMRAMKNEHPFLRVFVEAIQNAQEPAKQISNVIHVKRSPYGRIHTGYNGVGTTTSRLSASEPPHSYGSNLQNWRKDYRDILVAEPDSIIIEADLSAGDDVFVSFESSDPKKIELFRSGLDTHAVNAVLFFSNWVYEDIIKGKKAKDPLVVHPITGIRQITKKLAHGSNYLMAALTLLMTAGREAIVAAAIQMGYADAGTWQQARLVELCEHLESIYRNHYTRFKRSGDGSWYDDLVREVADTGGYTTPFGYFQRFLGDAHDPNVLRAVAATAGQAGTAGRINMAMDELTHGSMPRAFRDGPNLWGDERPRRVSRREHGISLRLQTHDSLTAMVNLRHSNWEEGVDNFFHVMNRPVMIRNSLTGREEHFALGIEADAGLAWGNGLKAIKTNNLEGFKATLNAPENKLLT